MVNHIEVSLVRQHMIGVLEQTFCSHSARMIICLLV